MLLRRLSVFLPLLCAVIAAKDFRFDYEYYPSVQGWLKLHLVPATWRDAWLRCDLEGSVLASPINTKMLSEMEALWMKKKSTQCGFYTGVHATYSKGDFSSVEGVPLLRMPVQWAVGEPDNAGNNEDCILMVNGTIADVNCSEVYPYMCFKKHTNDMFLTECGTVDREYELNKVTGSCYKFHHVSKPWRRAYMTCAAEGGYLAIINSAHEAQHLKALYHKNLPKTILSFDKRVTYVGFQSLNEPGSWRTVHGQKLEDAGYGQWVPNFPMLSYLNVSRTGYLFEDGQLAHIEEYKNAAFICEKSPASLLTDFEP